MMMVVWRNKSFRTCIWWLYHYRRILRNYWLSTLITKVKNVDDKHSCHYLFKSIACACHDKNVSDYLAGLVFTLWYYRCVLTNLLHIRLLLLRFLRTRKSSIYHLLIKDLDIIIIIFLPDTDFIHGWLEIYWICT